VLAGAFIDFCAMLYVVVITNSNLGFSPGRLLGGVVLFLGLILLLVVGAELFTGNSLIIIALADGKKFPTRACCATRVSSISEISLARRPSRSWCIGWASTILPTAPSE
jgi:hypothetical protein